MPFKGPKDNVEWLELSTFDDDIHITPEKGVQLAPDNLAPNQYGLEIDDYGDAVGYPLETPAPPSSRHVYVSDVAATKHDMRQQTLRSDPIENPFWEFAKPWVSTGARPIQSPQQANPYLARPLPPVIEAISGGVKGFSAGVHTIYFTHVTPSGKLHTLSGDGASITLSEGDGLKVIVPRSDVTGPLQPKVGIWSTTPGGDKSTARLQAVVNHDIENVTLTEFVQGRILPSWDETALWPPASLVARNIQRRRSSGSLTSGSYIFVRYYFTPYGTTLHSGNSPTIPVASGTGFQQAFFIPAPPTVPGATGWGLSVWKNGVWWRARRPQGIGDDAFSFSLGRDEIKVNGNFGANSERFDFVQEDPPVENTSGIEPLNEAPETPTAVLLSGIRPTPGLRWYAYAEVVVDQGGGESISLPSPAVLFDLTSGNIARVKFPDNNNLLLNPDGRIKNADGTPAGWTMSGTNGTYSQTVEGAHVLSTGGSAFASSTKQAQLPDIPIDAIDDYALVTGFAASITAGVAEMVYEELNGAGTVIGTITVKSISSSVSTFAVMRAGPNTARPFTAGTEKLRPKIRMTGASRNMTIWFWDMAAHPYIMAPRKVIPGDARQPASFERAPNRPYPRGVVKAVGPAPQTAEELSAPEAPVPFSEVNSFKAGATLPPTGWTRVQSGGITASAIVSGQGWHVQDLTTDAKRWDYIWKSFDAQVSNSFAYREIRKWATLPTFYSGRGELFLSWVDDSLGARMSHIALRNNVLTLVLTDNAGITTPFSTGVKVANGEKIDYEVKYDLTDMENVGVTVLVGKNGTQRTVRLEKTANWSGRSLDTCHVGVSEGPASMTYEYTIQRIRVGEVEDLFQEPTIIFPDADSALAPDRPDDGAGNYFAYDPDGATINQMYLFIPSGTARFNIPYFGILPVQPGVQYVFGVKGRHEIPFDEPLSMPWHLTLHNTITGEFVEVGSPYGVDGAAVGIDPWAEWATDPFIVPDEPGWVELRASHRYMGPGLYLWQMWAVSKGSALARGYGVASGPASFWTELDTITPGGEPRVPRKKLTGERMELDLTVSELPDNVTAAFQSSAVPSSWTDVPEHESPADVPDHTYYRIKGTLTSPDGRQTPFIPPTGPHIVTRPLKAVLLRRDGSELPGGCLVDGLDIPALRPIFESSRVGGHRHRVDITEPVMWTSPFSIEVYTEDAMNEFNENWFEDWMIQAPHLFNGVGAEMIIGFETEVTLVEEDLPHYYEGGLRWLLARANDIVAEVDEIEPFGEES